MKTEENKSRYTQEFKDSMVKLVAESHEPMSKIAMDVGINKKTLYGWVMKEKSSKIQLDKAIELTLQEETKQLKKQLDAMCTSLNVVRSTYYKWRKTPQTAHDERDAALMILVQADHMKTSLVNDAMQMAIWQRKPPRGVLWHTDRGSQYASKQHRDLLAEHGIRQSMSRKGNCWDNAVSESFFHTLKTELTYHHRYVTHEQAKASIFEYIAVFYNRIRIHSANDYLSPVEFEFQHAKNDSNFSVLKNVA